MMRFNFIRVITITSCLLLAATVGCARAATAVYEPVINQSGKDVVWVPTPLELVEEMLNMAKVTSSDYVMDLGSGDGGIVIAAARRGATALGIEYNPDMVAYARQAADKAGVTAKASFEKADLFETDFSKATVITMFLLPEINLKLRPKILDLKPGTRIVSNSFDMGDWKPDQTTELPDIASAWDTAYLWIVPAKVDGIWSFDKGTINFNQEFQEITGKLNLGQEVDISGSLNGNTITFTAGGRNYTGTVNGNAIIGTHDGGGAWRAAR
jgi:SAM-dependent methyltransferase